MEVSTLPRVTLRRRNRLLTLLPSGGQMPAKFLLLTLWCPWTNCSVSVVSDIIKKDSRRCRSRQILNPKASLRGAWIQGRGVCRWPCFSSVSSSEFMGQTLLGQVSGPEDWICPQLPFTFIHSFNKHFRNAYDRSGTVLSTGHNSWYRVSPLHIKEFHSENECISPICL